MVVIRRIAPALLAMVLAAVPFSSQANSPGLLSEAWLQSLAVHEAPVAWSHAVAVRASTQERLPTLQRRLVAELDTLVGSARLAGGAGIGQGMAEWRARVAEAGPEALRTPGRHDLPWIAADLRRDLPIQEVKRWGLCTPPEWVEVWHHQGVSRVSWQSEMTLRDVVESLPGGAWRAANQAIVVTPTGESLTRGVASWNRESASLAPGSRVMLALPDAQGLRAALPFPGTVEEAGWVNQSLPEFLAMQLPADHCTLWEP